MSDLSPDARALLDSVSDIDDPTDSERRGLDRKMAARFGAAAIVASGLTVSASATAAGGIATTSSLTLIKILASVLLVGAVSTGVYFAAARPSTQQRASVASPIAAHFSPVAQPTSVPAIAPVPTPIVATTETIVAPVLPSSSQTVAHSARPSRNANPVTRSSVDDLAGEATLVRSANSALRDHDERAALSALIRADQQYPNGVLTEERGAARVLALCGLGRIAEARTRGRSFVSHNPHSPLVERVRASCAFHAEGEP